jgi:endoglucanase
VPVLVAYYIPRRDCSQFSAGGAPDSAAYAAWIDGFADGIGNGKAVVVLEPDGLGIIPGVEWCTGAPEETAARYAELNAAVDRLEQQPQASVYLDGTHSHWLGVGEIAKRLVAAGVMRAQGFFLNVSNYQGTPQGEKYGTWIAKCIYYANNPAEGGWRLGRYEWCASQYFPANADDFSTWGLTDQWYADNVDNAANPPAGPSALRHFVVDTSRNGAGPWDPSPYRAAPYDQTGDLQDWCNPPGRGAGVRPTADTGVALLDAYVWVKVPGESDGQCNRSWSYATYTKPSWPTDAAQRALFDPVREAFDPAAGAWFPAMALELARNASPPLR